MPMYEMKIRTGKVVTKEETEMSFNLDYHFNKLTAILNLVMLKPV